ncbi:MAG: hypothetical protein AAGL17_25140, partial [Cyanobacteria bacterium J06576_12]
MTAVILGAFEFGEQLVGSVWPGEWLQYAPHLLWALIAIFAVEMVRDFYHFLSHQWSPLQRLHNWHHRAYKKDFSPINVEVYRQAQLYNDAPEAIFMMVVMAIAAGLTHIVGLWMGVVYAVGFLAAEGLTVGFAAVAALVFGLVASL